METEASMDFYPLFPLGFQGRLVSAPPRVDDVLVFVLGVIVVLRLLDGHVGASSADAGLLATPGAAELDHVTAGRAFAAVGGLTHLQGDGAGERVGEEGIDSQKSLVENGW